MFHVWKNVSIYLHQQAVKIMFLLFGSNNQDSRDCTSKFWKTILEEVRVANPQSLITSATLGGCQTVQGVALRQSCMRRRLMQHHGKTYKPAEFRPRSSMIGEGSLAGIFSTIFRRMTTYQHPKNATRPQGPLTGKLNLPRWKGPLTKVPLPMVARIRIGAA